MDTCHYCCDAIDKLSKDYDKIYKELQVGDSLFKKRNFHNIICEIDYQFYNYKSYLSDCDIMREYDEEGSTPGSFVQYVKNMSNEETFFEEVVKYKGLVMRGRGEEAVVLDRFKDIELCDIEFPGCNYYTLSI